MKKNKLSEKNDPFLLFKKWYELAQENEINDPNAMCLATVNNEGMPSARMVLLKEFDEKGFVFYTNLESRKGHQLKDNPQAALCFHWKSIKKQVRVEGIVLPVSEDQADAYFASRPRGSQIGAWASKQSMPLKSFFELEKRVAKYTAKFGLKEIKRPDYWSGFIIKPERIEFWEDGKFRLHQRLVYTQQENKWITEKLYP